MRFAAIRWTIPAVLATALMGCSGGAQQAAAPPVDQAAIGAAIDSSGAAFNVAMAARDTDTIVNRYTDDARVLPANMPRADGRTAIRQVMVGFLSVPEIALTIKSTDKIIDEDGNMAVDLGTYDMTWQGAKKKAMHDAGKYVAVYKKVNGAWKIVVDTWNSDMPAPGM